MEKEMMRSMQVLTFTEVCNTYGGYAPPEDWWDDLLNPDPEPKPFDPVCW